MSYIYQCNTVVTQLYSIDMFLFFCPSVHLSSMLLPSLLPKIRKLLSKILRGRSHFSLKFWARMNPAPLLSEFYFQDFNQIASNFCCPCVLPLSTMWFFTCICLSQKSRTAIFAVGQPFSPSDSHFRRLTSYF